MSDAAHIHTWEPIVGWYARYRCMTCWMIGYKPKLVTIQSADIPGMGSVEIKPYHCGVRVDGRYCGKGAIKRARGKYLCREHAG